MKLTAFICDCGCGANGGVSASHESHPKGWLLLFGWGSGESGQLVFATRACLRRFVTDRDELPAPVMPPSMQTPGVHVP